MRTSTRFLSALAVAGMIAASGSAFTAANTGLVAGEFVGYQSTTVSGVTVTNVAYNASSTDASVLSSIVFTETENVSTGYKAILSVTTASGTTQSDCSTPTYPTGGPGSITCNTGATIAAVTGIALTVTAQ